MPNMKVYDKVTAITGIARMRVDQKPFDDKRVRQAIQACIDHQRVLDLAYQGLGVKGEDHPVSPIHPEYTEMPPLVQDYDKAKTASRCIPDGRSEEHTSELQSLMRISYAGFCLKKKTTSNERTKYTM